MPFHKTTGGYEQVAVTSPAGTTWTATPNVAWLSIVSGASGTGNGTVMFNVAANLGSAQRVGTLNIAGQRFTVTQAGPRPPTSIVPVVEYRNTATDDYFITTIPAEQAVVDSGVTGSWVRTGQNLNSAGITPVYRFGGTPIISTLPPE